MSGRLACAGQAHGEHGQCALERLRLPAAQVRENRSHHDRVLDQRNDAHRTFAFGTCQGIGFVQTPAVFRKRDRAAQVEALANSGVDKYDILAFLRKQAD